MLKQRRTLWPAELGPNTPADRARTVARGYRALAVKYAPAAELAALDAFTARVGEAAWLMPTAATWLHGEPLTCDQVATRAGVAPPAVVMWGRRGIRRDGVTHKLQPGPDGLYDHRAVDEFLDLRDTPATREKPLR